MQIVYRGSYSTPSDSVYFFHFLPAAIVLTVRPPTLSHIFVLAPWWFTVARRGRHKTCQAANTFSLLVWVQEGTVVSPTLLPLPLKGKSTLTFIFAVRQHGPHACLTVFPLLHGRRLTITRTETKIVSQYAVSSSTGEHEIFDKKKKTGSKASEWKMVSLIEMKVWKTELGQLRGSKLHSTALLH